MKKILMLFCLSFPFIYGFAFGDPPSQDDLKIANNLLKNYDDILKNVSPVAVWADALTTNHDTDVGRVKKSKFVYAFNGEGTFRYDSVVSLLYDGSGVGDVNYSVLITKERITTFLKGREMDRYERNRTPQQGDERPRECPMFNPFLAPIVGHTILLPRSVLAWKDMKFADPKFTEYQDESSSLGIEYEISAKDHIYKQLIFDKKLGVPVESGTVMGEMRHTHCKTTTTWTTFRNHLVPTEIDIFSTPRDHKGKVFRKETSNIKCWYSAAQATMFEVKDGVLAVDTFEIIQLIQELRDAKR